MKGQRKHRWMIPIIIFVIIIGIIAYLQYQKEKKEDALAITLVENRRVAFGQEVYVADFIQEIKGTITENTRIDTTTLGEKEVVVKYRNERNRKKKSKYTIEVVDEVDPIVTVSDSYTVKVGYQKDLCKVIFSGDNCDDTPTRKIEGSYNLNEVGEYPVTFVITDASGNETKKDFTLKVVEKVETTTKEKETKQWEDMMNQYKTEKTRLGIDVSKWQGEIDWQQVKDAGVEFAMLRIGYQDGKQGENVIDPYFYQNIQGAKKVGIPVGVYFYTYATSEKEGEEQAKWIIDHLQGNDLELPIAFDWENWSSFPEYEVSFYKLNSIANTFLETIASNGYTPSLYSSKNYLEKIWENTSYKVWVAHYIEQTNYMGEYHMWQICETGRVDGINEDVDIDILYY